MKRTDEKNRKKKKSGKQASLEGWLTYEIASNNPGGEGGRGVISTIHLPAGTVPA